MTYKYKVVKSPDISEQELNILGEKGWELVSIYKIHPENNYTRFIFKKEYKQHIPQEGDSYKFE